MNKFLYATRWVVVLPAAAIGALLAYGVPLIPEVLVFGEPHWWSKLVSSGLEGLSFGYFGAYVAPSHKKETTFTLSIVAIAFGVVFSGLFALGQEWFEAVQYLALIVGASTNLWIMIESNNSN